MESWETLSKWGCYSAIQIRAGAFWAFFTSVFVHLELWHLVFNLYWLYLLGSALERAIGLWRWLAFFVAASFVSSGAEFALADSTGIGASGVVYAMFGFMWLTRKRFPAFAVVLTPRNIGLFFIWLVSCVVMTVAQVWVVGNAAHGAGLLFGIAVGAWLLHERRRPLIAAGIAVLVLIAIVPIFWAPWSAGWTALQAAREYKKGDFAAAIHWYERSLKLGQDKTWCWQSIACAYYALGDDSHYQQALQTLRALDQKAAGDVEAEIARVKKSN
jgi:GlpG protein